MIAPTITVSAHKKIKDLQEEFSNIYPYLRIEFAEPLQPGRTRGRLDTIRRSDARFRNSTHTAENNTIRITPDTTISNLEDTFREHFGVGIQVFRKSGKVWLETTMTDHWTLQEQSVQAEALSHFMK